MTTPRTMFQKIWDAHVVAPAAGGGVLLYIDRHLVNEVTSPQAFEGLRLAGRSVHRPGGTIAVADHNVPTEARDRPIADAASREQVETLERNVVEFDVPYVPLRSRQQGIVHVIGPEMGLTLPGMTVVCGDSHTSTHGAFGALAFGIGTSEVEHVLASQTLIQKPAKNMLVQIDGLLGAGVTGKDLILAIIGQLGTAGATGYVIEYAGEAIRALDMAGRMTVCNMSIEAGTRAGLIAPDDKTFAWIKGRPMAPQGEAFEAAKAVWRALATDAGATFERVVLIDAASVEPMVTWGTSPEAVTHVHGATPSLEETPEHRRAEIQRMFDYMGLQPGQPLLGLPIDVVFIGSCTNSRIEDLRAAARLVEGRKVADGTRALVVPGSGAVKAQAEAEGLASVFLDAGFEWREAGCSMCLGMNPDQLMPGQRCASTSNRNFEGRQGVGGRTHLMSPVMAAAAAVSGKIVDSRELAR